MACNRRKATRHETSNRSDEVDRVRAIAEERSIQTDLLRCIFGNPFQAMEFDPAWVTATVASLAHAAYDERLEPSYQLDHSRLAVLSDALEEAGCTDAAILDHLRSPGPHVRGCWVIDSILGKS